MAPAMKFVLINGCSAGGIGAGLAEAFHQAGYHVFLTLRNLAKTPTNLANAQNVTVLQLDVLSPESIAAAVESVTQKTGGRLDVLVNNSGQNLIMPALDMNVVDGRRLFDVNFFALWLSCRPSLLFSSKPVAPSFTTQACTTAKAALTIASSTWRRELAPLGVRTIALITTSVKTPAFDNVTMPEIPEGFYYYVIREYLYRLGSGQPLQDGAPDPVAYGLGVVGAIDAGKTGEIWVGKDAGVNYWSWKLLAESVFDSMVDGILKAPGEFAKVAEALKGNR
ncbi:Uu.00g048020.m01.CDS01 [Anthostomella pinea]|uniref:Uu.00g048020.m01.CDS01 n=1 Tax=Anthostomella pinea TaxID=933095 RepID=A0AAI8VBM9_9PEZI|nr:Uu.00g048020.m01.CDS01 [Anthostomella pinea]